MFAKGRRSSYVDDADASPEHPGVSAFGRPDRRDEPAEVAGDEDPLTFGTGVVASFLARAIQEERIEILTSHPVTELLRDERGAVIGARANGPDGTVERHGPVVLATSSFDWDPELVQELLGLDLENFGSVAPESLRGDGIKLARSVGGAVARIPPTSVPMLPGWPSQVGTGYGYGPEFALPHAMIVDRTGRRYCNDSYWVDIVAKTLDPNDRHLPFFLIWDDQHRRKYGLGATPPGGEYPAGVISSAPTLSELGSELGIDGEQLERTAAHFSAHAELGEDPEWGRGSVAFVERFTGDPNHTPNAVLGPITESPFFGVRLKIVGTGIGSSGVHVNGDGHVLDEAGTAIPGLYAVGSCAALTSSGTGYNSGFALGRGLTLAYLVARELGGSPGEDR
jgi:3-oxosteroid 1-dehydrogenase